MKRRKKFYVFTAWAVLSAAGVAHAAAEPKQFSADMVMQGPQGVIQAKLYVGDRKTRMEMPQAITILRLDRSLSYILMPSQHMYMEHPLDMNMVAQTSTSMPGETERKSLGKESVNGVPAEKFQVTFSQAGQAPQTVYQWTGPNGIPVKIASVDGSWSVEYCNIQAASQPDSLFEPPADYQKFAMPNMADYANMQN